MKLLSHIQILRSTDKWDNILDNLTQNSKEMANIQVIEEDEVKAIEKIINVLDDKEMDIETKKVVIKNMFTNRLYLSKKKTGESIIRKIESVMCNL